MSHFDFKKFVKNLLLEEVNEAGYAGGPSSVYGAATFRGGPYGFGGSAQLATEPVSAVKKLKKQRDKEATINIEDQMKINRGYPAPQSVSGYPGGESKSGIRSGARIPNSINQIALPADQLDVLDFDDPTKQYWGFEESDEWDEEEEVQEVDPYDDLIEAMGAGGGFQGPQRGAASDGNYRDLPGYPRHNAIERDVDFIPDVEGDKDDDGEEDVYLSDEEYVNDVLRLNGIDVPPGQKKRLFGAENLDEARLVERTLYHGTINDHYDSIEKYGLTGDLGDWVKDAYGMELDEDEWDEHLGGISFAASKNDIEAAVGAMRYHVGKKLGKWLGDVDEEDLRKHGMLVVIRDVDEPEEIKYPEDVEEDKWYHRPKEDENYHGAYPMSVEPGDWFIKGGAGIDDVLTGNKMIQVLRRMGGLKRLETDMRRKLIKMMVAVHGPKERKHIIAKVSKLPERELQKYLDRYEKEGNEIIAKRRAEQAQMQKSPQLAFDFGEAKYSLKTIFTETYVAPSYGPEPDKGIERYKQGEWVEDHEPGIEKKLIKHVDYTGGHQNMPPAEESPGAQTYGNVAFPKKFVPDDWEQRHPKTKSIDDDRTMNEELKEMIRQMVREAIQEAYTGVRGTEKDKPKGGSAAFEKSREKVIAYDKKHRPAGPEDLENYHMGEE